MHIICESSENLVCRWYYRMDINSHGYFDHIDFFIVYGHDDFKLRHWCDDKDDKHEYFGHINIFDDDIFDDDDDEYFDDDDDNDDQHFDGDDDVENYDFNLYENPVCRDTSLTSISKLCPHQTFPSEICTSIIQIKVFDQYFAF